MYAENQGGFKSRLAAQDPELAAALAENDQSKIEKVVGDRLKEQIDKQRANQERILKLHHADPNDAEAQKQIEEEIRKSVIESNY